MSDVNTLRDTIARTIRVAVDATFPGDPEYPPASARAADAILRAFQVISKAAQPHDAQPEQVGWYLPDTMRPEPGDAETLVAELLPGRMLQLVSVPDRPRSEPYGAVVLMVYKVNSTDLEFMVESDTLHSALTAALGELRGCGMPAAELAAPPAEREQMQP